MKKHFLLSITALLITFSFISCSQKYEYTEILVQDRQLGVRPVQREQTKTIKAANDDEAYVLAFNMFVSGISAAKAVEEFPVMGTAERMFKPVDFYLTDKNGNIISGDISEEAKNRIKRMRDYHMYQTLGLTEFDEEKLLELKKFFYVQQDEYSENIRWCIHHYADVDGKHLPAVFLYFQFDSEDWFSTVGNLRLRIISDNPSPDVKFYIDGKVYEYTAPHAVSSRNYEVYRIDEPAIESNKELIHAIANGKEVSIAVGKSYFGLNNKSRISQKDLVIFRQTLEFYNAYAQNY